MLIDTYSPSFFLQFSNHILKHCVHKIHIIRMSGNYCIRQFFIWLCRTLDTIESPFNTKACAASKFSTAAGKTFLNDSNWLIKKDFSLWILFMIACKSIEWVTETDSSTWSCSILDVCLTPTLQFIVDRVPRVLCRMPFLKFAFRADLVVSWLIDNNLLELKI